jgi:hypothetical protein
VGLAGAHESIALHQEVSDDSDADPQGTAEAAEPKRWPTRRSLSPGALGAPTAASIRRGTDRPTDHKRRQSRPSRPPGALGAPMAAPTRRGTARPAERER